MQNNRGTQKSLCVSTRAAIEHCSGGYPCRSGYFENRERKIRKLKHDDTDMGTGTTDGYCQSHVLLTPRKVAVSITVKGEDLEKFMLATLTQPLKAPLPIVAKEGPKAKAERLISSLNASVSMVSKKRQPNPQQQRKEGR